MNEEQNKNQNGKKPGSREALIIALNDMKYFCVAYFFVALCDYSMYGSKVRCLYCLLLLIAAVVSCCLELYAARIWQFFAGHGAVLCYCLFLGRSSGERVVFVLYGLLLFGVAWVKHNGSNKKRVPENASLGFLALGLFGLLYARIRGFTYAYELFFWVASVYLLLHLLNLYLANQNTYLQNSARTADNVERRRVQADGNLVMGVYLPVSAGLLFLAGQVGAEGILDAFFDGIYRGLRWFLGVFTHFEAEEYTETIPVTPAPTPERAVTGETEIGNPLLQEFMRMVAVAMIFVIKILAVVAVVAFLVAVVYVMWKSFYSHGADRGEAKEEVEKLHEKRKSAGKRKRQPVLFGGDPAHRVRRLFRKRILEGRQEKTGNGNSRTAAEWVSTVREEDRKAVERILPVYRKARYSREKVTKEEYEFCKKQGK